MPRPAPPAAPLGVAPWALRVQVGACAGGRWSRRHRASRAPRRSLAVWRALPWRLARRSVACGVARAALCHGGVVGTRGRASRLAGRRAPRSRVYGGDPLTVGWPLGGFGGGVRLFSDCFRAVHSGQGTGARGMLAFAGARDPPVPRWYCCPSCHILFRGGPQRHRHGCPVDSSPAPVTRPVPRWYRCPSRHMRSFPPLRRIFLPAAGLRRVRRRCCLARLRAWALVATGPRRSGALPSTARCAVARCVVLHARFSRAAAPFQCSCAENLTGASLSLVVLRVGLPFVVASSLAGGSPVWVRLRLCV
jgi:hypothetical protein